MPKKMPGYSEYQQEQENKRKAKEAAIQEQNRKKAEKEAEKKAEKLKKAKEKIQDKKIKAVGKKLRPQAFSDFLKYFFVGQMIGFVIGSTSFALEEFGGPEIIGEHYDEELGQTVIDWSESMYDGISYWQAIKNAYGFGDWKDGTAQRQMIANLIFTMISLSIALKKSRTKQKQKANEILSKLERLKGFGIDVEQLATDLTPSINKMLESLSAMDRGYFDNLAAGGLDKAKYETCVAIIAGYLKSHPKEYNKVITIIDEATLPEWIKKKYGKGKTISFGAAQALVQER